jgi:hypothetical protein
MRKIIALTAFAAGMTFGIFLTIPFINQERGKADYWKARSESFYKSFKKQNSLIKKCNRIMNQDNVIIMRNYE